MTSELRHALEVWDLLWDAFTGTPPQSGNPNAPFEAAAAVIQAYGDEREAKGREEQAAELAKFKALAETLAGALEKIGLGFTIELDDEDGPVNVWMDAEELSDLAREALRKWEEARDVAD